MKTPDQIWYENDLAKRKSEHDEQEMYKQNKLPPILFIILLIAALFFVVWISK